MVNTLHPYNEGDEATLLVEYLTLFGVHLGLKPRFYIGKTPHHARIFMAVVGQSGASRKGTTYNLVASVFENVVEPDFLRRNTRKNVGSDQGIISAALDSIEWAQDNGHDDGRLVVVENEFVSLLSGGTLQRTSPMIRDSWDTSVMMSTVKKARWAEPIHMGFIGMITLDELRHLLPNPRVGAQISNGLFNRFLLVLAQPSKQLRLDQMEVPEADMERLQHKTARAIAHARRLGTVPISPTVIQAQFEWRQAMLARREREIKKAKVAHRMFDLLNRGETYLLRLAFIYAMLDHASEVRLSHYTAAEALWKYVEDSVRYIFEIPEFGHNAQKILQAITEAGPNGITTGAAYDLLSRNNEYVKSAIQELVDGGIITKTTEKQPNGGRGRSRTMLRLGVFSDLDLEDDPDDDSPTR